MKFTFDVTFADGRTVRVVVGPRSMVEFERHFGMPVSDIASQSRLEWLLFLAWDACVRARSWSGTDFEAFVDEVAAVESVEDEESPLSGTREGQAA